MASSFYIDQRLLLIPLLLFVGMITTVLIIRYRSKEYRKLLYLMYEVDCERRGVKPAPFKPWWSIL